ncbi:MAG: potassium-transporting ATPase subunit KdpA, partial [Acidaminococcaceae bacterium]
MLNDLFLFIAYFAVLLLIALPLGKYMTKVFSPQKTLLDHFFAPIENAIYRLAKLDSAIEMNWREYAK